jgi:hypothetical protein
MESALERRKKINSVLAIYSGFLDELSEDLGHKNIVTDYPSIRERAFMVIDKALSGRELEALLMIEGKLRGKFPGVERRIKELLRKEIIDSVVASEK